MAFRHATETGFVERVGRRVGLGAAGVLAFRYAQQRLRPVGKQKAEHAAILAVSASKPLPVYSTYVNRYPSLWKME